MSRHQRRFVRQVLLVLGLVALFIGMALFSWMVIDILLLAFLGVLLEVGCSWPLTPTFIAVASLA